jgi:hypothetical protein
MVQNNPQLIVQKITEHKIDRCTFWYIMKSETLSSCKTVGTDISGANKGIITSATMTSKVTAVIMLSEVTVATTVSVHCCNTVLLQ